MGLIDNNMEKLKDFEGYTKDGSKVFKPDGKPCPIIETDEGKYLAKIGQHLYRVDLLGVIAPKKKRVKKAKNG